MKRSFWICLLLLGALIPIGLFCFFRFPRGGVLRSGRRGSRMLGRRTPHSSCRVNADSSIFTSEARRMTSSIEIFTKIACAQYNRTA